ncbi:hypothetical protein F4779DRAFT_196982 [Xylariaceae sp. FL0662B]|nr:hypothetical protein F4779DRAFT_196982 [Xylariaceae sp. FL0662B]
MLLLVFTSLLILFLGQARTQDVGPCAVGCVDGVFANSVNLGCAAGDQLCLCAKTAEMADGIRDCVNSACANDAAAQEPLAQAYGSNQCKAASSKAGLLPAATPTANPSPPAAEPTTTGESPPATTPTTAAAETAKASPSPSPEPTTTPSPSPSPSSASPTQAVAAVSPSTSDTTSEATSPASASTEASSIAGSSTSSSVSAYITVGTSVGSAATAQNSDQASSSTDGSGLTTAAKGGIGAGVGAAAIMAAVIAFCLCMRRRQKKKREAEIRARSLQISQPLPGSGRQYADNLRQAEAGLSMTFSPTSTPNIGQALSSPTPESRTTKGVSLPSTASYYSELDHNLRRYEEITPQTQPRTMI